MPTCACLSGRCLVLVAIVASLGAGGILSGGRAEANSLSTGAMIAAPWAIIAYGGPLEKRVVIADWNENLRLMLAAEPLAADAHIPLGGRPQIELALFWGPEWKHLETSPEAVARLDPAQANQRARFYPAYGERPAAMVLSSTAIGALTPPLLVRTVERDGLDMLAAHGVPVRIER